MEKDQSIQQRLICIDDFSLPIKQVSPGRYLVGKKEYISIEEYNKLLVIIQEQNHIIELHKG